MIYANRKHPTPINTLKQKFILKYSVFQKGAIIVPSISMSISQSFFGKFTAKSKDQSSKPQRKLKQHVVFDDMVINTEPYEGRDSLSRTERPDAHTERYVNPKSSFYLCKILEGKRPFELLPMSLIRRVAYRKDARLDQSGRVIYNDPECKNYDQIATEFHCYTILRRCHRAIQMLGVSHENTRNPEDKKLYYQIMKLPDRRAQGIKNIMFVLEEMNGGSLKEQIDRIIAKKQDPFTEHEVIEYSCQIAQGLQELKLRGIIHRDLRPENILFHNKQIKISDFDSAFIKGYSDYRNIRTGLNMKDTTPLEIMQLIAESEDRLKQYTSEELWEVQQHADIYFLGVNIYTMVFSTPFESFNGGKILNNLINIKKRNGYSPKLLDVMARCLEKDVHKRISLEDAVRRLSEIEREAFMNHPTYTRIYLSSDPLSLYNFSSNQIEQKLQFEQADFVKFSLKIDPIEMEELFEATLRRATLERKTKYYEGVLKETLVEKENESIWYDSPSLNLLHSERRKLRAAVEQALERLQIKTFYFQLLYRILCEVNLDRLVVQAQSYYADNVQSHLDLLSAEIVVVLTFLYDMIMRCNFTVDPYYAPEEVGYETQRIYDSTRVLAARRSFFACRKRGLENSFNINELTTKLEEFKAQHANKEEIDQVEQGVNFVIKNIRKVEALEKLIKDFEETEYDQAEKRKVFWYEYSTLTKFLDRIERVLKSQMVQTNINLIISYEKLKNSKRGADPSLKNAIFMLMIMEAQNTNHLYKNDLVIIKEELTRRINFRVGWKEEELEAFFANYTQTHQQEVLQGLHELESQAVLGGSPSTLNIEEPEDEVVYEVKVAEDSIDVPSQDFKIVVEEVPEAPGSQQRSRREESTFKFKKEAKEPKMEAKVSIEDKKEEGSLSFRASEHAEAELIEQEEDDMPVPEIKVIDPSSVKTSAGMERSQTFEFQFEDNSSFIRSSIPVEAVENIDL